VGAILMKVGAFLRLAAAAALGVFLSNCAGTNPFYKPARNVPLTANAPRGDTACTERAATPRYDLDHIKDCTSAQSFVVFAFSGGGIRSASFGYGALAAAHAMQVPGDTGTPRTLDKEIDIISGVSGGSFTAAAYASKRDTLFPAPGGPDYYRNNFLTHDFFDELLAIYLEPWHWQWMLPGYGTNDEMANIYAGVDFSSDSDKLFARSFGDLANKGRPLLIVQATDYGNEQPFTFTQDDFDLICSDVNDYPVANAIAASTAFPLLFSPIQLKNRHFTADSTDPHAYCHAHRLQWVDAALDAGEPEELSRAYARAEVADGYLPSSPKHKMRGANPYGWGYGPAPLQAPPKYLYLADGGIADNMALRGLMNTVTMSLGGDPGSGGWTQQSAAIACKIHLDQIRKLLIVVVDGEARPNNRVSHMSSLSDIGVILDSATSAAIDASGFETMLAAEAMTKRIAAKMRKLHCGTPPAEGASSVSDTEVKSYFAHVSFHDLSEATTLDPAACGKSKGDCTMSDVARSGTRLDFSGPEVDALVKAGSSAFFCNRNILAFLRDSKAIGATEPVYPCAIPGEKTLPPPP
jgi:NTE family protein